MEKPILRQLPKLKLILYLEFEKAHNGSESKD